MSSKILRGSDAKVFVNGVEIGRVESFELSYGPDPEKLKEYAEIDAQQAERMLREYRGQFPIIGHFHNVVSGRHAWVQQIKANYRRNKKRRQRSKQ